MQTTTPTASAAAPAPTATGPSYVVERPPPGLARGRYPVPAWLVATLAAVMVAAIVAFFVIRRRRARRGRRYESVAPTSVPPSSRHNDR